MCSIISFRPATLFCSLWCRAGPRFSHGSHQGVPVLKLLQDRSGHSRAGRALRYRTSLFRLERGLALLISSFRMLCGLCSQSDVSDCSSRHRCGSSKPTLDPALQFKTCIGWLDCRLMISGLASIASLHMIWTWPSVVLFAVSESVTLEDLHAGRADPKELPPLVVMRNRGDLHLGFFCVVGNAVVSLGSASLAAL